MPTHDPYSKCFIFRRIISCFEGTFTQAVIHYKSNKSPFFLFFTFLSRFCVGVFLPLYLFTHQSNYATFLWLFTGFLLFCSHWHCFFFVSYYRILASLFFFSLYFLLFVAICYSYALFTHILFKIHIQSLKRITSHNSQVSTAVKHTLYQWFRCFLPPFGFRFAELWATFCFNGLDRLGLVVVVLLETSCRSI